MPVSIHPPKSSTRALIDNVGDDHRHRSDFGKTVRLALKELHNDIRYLSDVTVDGITSGSTDMTPYFKLSGRAGGQTGHGGTGSTDTLTLRGNTVATTNDWIKIPIFTASTSATPDTNRILRLETSDAVNIFSVQGDGATTITAPYTTYTSGNPILLTLQMDDATSSPSTIFRVRTQSANVFTISYTGGTVIDMATDNQALTVQGGGATANLMVLQTSTPTTVLAVGPTGLTSYTPTAVGSIVSIKAFSTASTNVFLDFIPSSGGTAIGRVVLTNAVPRLLLGTTSVNNSIINVVPPSATAQVINPVLRAIWTDTAATQGASNGIVNISPTLSDATNGVAAGNTVIVNMTCSNLIGDWNGIKINANGGEEDALTGGNTVVLRGIEGEAKSTAGTLSALRGFQFGARHASSGTLAIAAGGSYYLTTNAGAGTIATGDVLVCIGGSTIIASGTTITDFSMHHIEQPTITGTATTFSGLKIDALSGGGTTWAINSLGGQSRHVGNLRIGSTSAPTVALDVTGSVNVSTLTAGRVVFAGAGGLLADDADLTFATDRLTSTKITTTLETFTSSAAPGSPADGDLWNDSTQETLVGFTSGIKQHLVGCIFSKTDTTTVSNTVTETSLIGSGVGTVTLPANFFAIGKTVRVRAVGRLSTDVINFGGSVRLRYGGVAGTIVAAATQPMGGSGLTNNDYVINIDVTCRTTGGTGTVLAVGTLMYAGSPAAATYITFGGVSTVTIDTTAASDLVLTAQWTTADTDNTINCALLTMEVLD